VSPVITIVPFLSPPPISLSLSLSPNSGGYNSWSGRCSHITGFSCISNFFCSFWRGSTSPQRTFPCFPKHPGDPQCSLYDLQPNGLSVNHAGCPRFQDVAAVSCEDPLFLFCCVAADLVLGSLSHCCIPGLFRVSSCPFVVLGFLVLPGPWSNPF
jgi:hypothetical protein